MVRAEIVGGRHESYIRFLAEVALDADDSVGGVLAVIRRGRGKRVAGIAVVHCEEADLPWAGATGEARADLRILNGAAEEEVVGRLKVRGVFQKEGTQLREKYFESLIDGDLRVLRFDLAEIGIHGDVERKGIVDNRLQIDAGAQR